MSTSLQRLLPLFERERLRDNALVLATVVRTAGPTYTKRGAQMLIARSGEYAGLLSGGCLEGDLSARAARVFDSGACEIVRYDMRGSDDLLFGLGSGCEGAMDILLQRIDAAGRWQPLARLAAARCQDRPEQLLLMVGRTVGFSPSFAGADAAAGVVGCGIFVVDGEVFSPIGVSAAEDSSWLQTLQRVAATVTPGLGGRLLPPTSEGMELFVLEQAAPTRLLILGAGPDALPVVEMSAFLGWRPIVVDHRSHFAQPARFLCAEVVLDGGVQALTNLLRTDRSGAFDAAIVMSHHFLSDVGYVRALAASDIPYIGLLGPISRRDRLLIEFGTEASRIGARLHAPAGLDLGAASPETIALSIIAEIQGVLTGHTGIGPLSARYELAAGKSVAFTVPRTSAVERAGASPSPP